MYDFTKNEIKSVIDNSKSMAEASKKIGVNYDTFKKYAKKFGLFKTNQSGKGLNKGIKYKTCDDIFQKGIYISSDLLKKWLLKERDWCCEKCNIYNWNDEPLTFEIDHIDGDTTNNLRENLKILCPNCHSQTLTWRGRNINSIKKKNIKVNDDDLLNALNECNSIREALIKVNLAPKGGNYNRAYKLLSKKH